jgi:hypothetical protein
MRSGDSQVFQFSLTVSEASDNLSEGVGATHLAEEHGHELAPTGEASGMTFGVGSLNCLLKLGPRK